MFVKFIKEHSMMLVLSVTFLFMFIFIKTITPVTNYVRYLYIFLIVAYVIIRQRQIILTKSVAFVLMLLFFHISLSLLIHPLYISAEVINNAKDMILFFLFVVFTLQYIWKNDYHKSFIICMQVVTSLFLTYCYITNFTSIAPLKFLPALIFGGSRVRFSVGFVSYNQAAYVAVALFVLTVIAWRTVPRKRSIFNTRWSAYDIYLAFSAAVSILVVLSTQTRGAILSMILFWALSHVMIKGKFFRIQLRRVNWIIYVCIILIVFLAYAYYVFVDSFSRASFLSDNFEIYLASGKIWTGLGYLPFSAFLGDNFGLGTPPLDCYYLYILCTTGIIGFVLVIITMLFMLFKFVKMYCKYDLNKLEIQFIVVYLMMLYVSFSESTFISYFAPDSYAYWIMWFLLLMRSKTENNLVNN